MSQMQALTITPLPAFNDNYLWLLARGTSAAIVDPGDAGPVMRALDRHELRLDAILVTHHHPDHVGGVMALKQRYRPTVYGPAREQIPARDRALAGGNSIEVLDTRFEVIDVPGHTSGHIAYYAESESAVFCGDTMFACGCGRLFEGTPAQMLASLQTLAALPTETRVYCAHEYTLANIRFALAVEPGNVALQARAAAAAETRRRGEPTVPSTIGLELATNPFMRCDVPAVRDAAARREKGAETAALRTFAALREWKNGFG
jgi:hydroxyacylglutathione hydrolase